MCEALSSSGRYKSCSERPGTDLTPQTHAKGVLQNGLLGLLWRRTQRPVPWGVPERCGGAWLCFVRAFLTSSQEQGGPQVDVEHHVVGTSLVMSPHVVLRHPRQPVQGQ